MTPRRWGLALLAALAVPAVGLLLQRHVQSRPTGFVAVQTTFALPASDIFLLGSTPLDPLNKGVPAEATFVRPVGSDKLQLRRAGTVLDVCDVAVRANRITSVTLLSVGNRMRCRIDA